MLSSEQNKNLKKKTCEKNYSIDRILSYITLHFYYKFFIKLKIIKNESDMNFNDEK